MVRSSFLTTALQRRLGDTAFERLKGFLGREWFLSLLLVLYLVLALLDPSFVRRTPHLIEWGSLSLITALILTSKGLELSGIFSKLAPKLVEKAGGSERKLVAYLLMVVAVSSAVIMNDTAMLVFIPLVVVTSRVAKINVPRAVTLSAIAANVGSALTPIGNPQNIIIWHDYRVSFLSFLVSMFPFVLAWFLLLLAFTLSVPAKEVHLVSVPQVAVNRRLLTVSSLLLVLNILLAEMGVQYWGFIITLVTMALLSREALLSFDWALVVIFSLVFADFGELARILSSSGLALPSSGLRLLLTSAGLSQLVSNVPATVLFLSSGSNSSWATLASGVNLGGNGIIVGSLANLIALRIARISLRDFHRYSIPYFLAAITVSVLIFLL